MVTGGSLVSEPLILQPPESFDPLKDQTPVELTLACKSPGPHGPRPPLPAMGVNPYPTIVAFFKLVASSDQGKPAGLMRQREVSPLADADEIWPSGLPVVPVQITLHWAEPSGAVIANAPLSLKCVEGGEKEKAAAEPTAPKAVRPAMAMEATVLMWASL
jgi:hypothetical protein